LEEYLINHDIDALKVRLIDDFGMQQGILNRKDALLFADRKGLDLVQITYKDEVPVCKIMDYCKFKFEQKKKENQIERQNREKRVELKEIRIRYNTDTNDLSIKAKKAKEFLDDGDKVKLTLRLRGREMSHMDVANKTISKFLEHLPGVTTKKSPDENNTIIIILG